MAETTLAQTLSDAFDEVEELPVTPITPPVEEIEKPAAPVQAQEEPKAGRTAGRARDERGKLLPGKAAKPAEALAPVVDPLAAPVVERKAPSSWKKEYWEDFGKLDPKVADYIKQREEQFASGVSTYKAEADSAREINDAMQQFQPDFQAAGITPVQGFVKLASAHRMIMSATAQDKPLVFSRLMKDYGIGARMVTQDAQGQWQFLDESRQPAMQQQAQPVQDIPKLVQEELAKQAMQNEVNSFLSDTAKYPHVETVRPAMIRLLDSGLAPDLKSAYDQAIRLNDELWQSSQQQSTDAERQRQEAAAKVGRARANAVSPKSATPAGVMTTTGKRDVRSVLEEQVEAHLGGRV